MAGIGTDVDSSLHEMALLWFKQRAGTVIPWPVPLDGMYLANKAKGIHKPAGLEYALSIRQSLNGPYDDSVNTLPDGSWEIRYAQEGSDPAQFTNKGLFACKRDGIPVGVILQVSSKPSPTYHVLGLGQVVDWNDGCFTVVEDRGFSSLATLANIDEEAGFSLTDARDSRLRILRAIAIRQGQPAFRKELLRAYGGACAVTGCGVVQTLEAAHISPYRGRHTNHVGNGLLLRADIHTLFDLGMVKIAPDSFRVHFHSSIANEYAAHHDKRLILPVAVADWPSREALLTRSTSAVVADDLTSVQTFI